MKSIYLLGSLKNKAVPLLGIKLRKEGFEVFDDWYGAGENADDCWRDYEKLRGRTYAEALDGWAAHHIFNFDLSLIHRCDIGVMLMPAGKSGHLELGYIAGQRKPTFICFDKEPERWDLMNRFAKKVCFSEAELIKELRKEL